jgi:large repetitive protein
MDNSLNLLTLSSTAEASPDLLAALQQAERQLATYLQGDDGLQKLFASFNGGNSEANSAWQQQAQAFLTALQGGELSVRLELRSSAELIGAYGAFAAAGPDGQPVIYLNEAWLPHLSDTDLTRLILEEAGHWIDNQINGSIDTPGDEGEAFAATVLGQELSEAEWARIHSENDTIRLTIDGVEIEVELASLLFTNDAFFVGSSSTNNQTQLETNSLYVEGFVGEDGTPLGTTGGFRYAFISIPEEDTTFNGNNVRGWLYVIDANNNGGKQ